MMKESGDRRLESGGRKSEEESREGEDLRKEVGERLKEVATILARGYLRLKKRNACLANPPMEAPGETDVHGSEPPSLACEESSPLTKKGLDSSANRSHDSRAR